MNTFLRAMTQAILLTATIGLLAIDDTGATTEVSEADAADHVSVTRAWIRATPPGHTVTGAFMTLINKSDRAFALTSVSFSDASTVEIHETSMKDGMMRMRKVDQIDIPANGSAELKPGSYHVMLIGLEKDMKAGATESMTLTFSDGSQKRIEALVGTSGEEHTHE
jgi:copper(I)-binding protein